MADTLPETMATGLETSASGLETSASRSLVPRPDFALELVPNPSEAEVEPRLSGRKSAAGGSSASAHILSTSCSTPQFLDQSETIPMSRTSPNISNSSGSSSGSGQKKSGGESSDKERAGHVRSSGYASSASSSNFNRQTSTPSTDPVQFDIGSVHLSKSSRDISAIDSTLSGPDITLDGGGSVASRSDLSESETTSPTGTSASSVKKEDRRKKTFCQKKSKSWYNALNPTYKTRSTSFKKIFTELPNDERLIVEYSCALQKDILIQGRIYFTVNYLCFYANIFTWETSHYFKWSDITNISKEKTALVIPNAIQFSTGRDKFFFASFASRDKTFTTANNLWQNSMLSEVSSGSFEERDSNTPTNIWQLIHDAYGDELGLTSDDENEYLCPYAEGGAGEDMSPSSNFSSREGSFWAKRSNKILNRENSRGSECDDPSQSSADPSADPNVGLVNQPTHDGGANHSSGFSFGRRKKKKSSTLRASDQNEGGAGRPANGGSVPCSEISDDCSEDLDDEDLDLVSDDLGVGHGGPRRRKDKGSSSKKGAKAIQKLFEEWRASQDGREVSNQVFNVDVDTLFTLLFTNSKFYADFHKARKTKDMAPSEWEQRSGTNDKFREVTMTLALTNPMGPKHSGVTDSQAMISDYAHHGEMYVVHVDTTNSGIPYSDSFYVTSNFCLTRVSKRQSKLVVMGDIKYKKSVWGFIKSVIEKNTWEGLEAFYNDLSSALHIASEELAAVEDIPIPMPSVSHPSTLRGVKKGGLDHAEPNGGLGPSGHYGSTHANLCSESNISSSMRKFPAQPGSDLGGIFFKLAVILLISLLGANCFLFYKMWFLETTLVVDRQLQESNSKRIDPMIHLDPAWFLAKDGETRSTQQWLEILRQQEMVHQLELEKWNEMLGAATQLLRRTESSLSNIQKSIQPLTLKKLRNVLLLHDSEGADDSPPVKAGKTRHDGIPLSENQEKIVKNEL